MATSLDWHALASEAKSVLKATYGDILDECAISKEHEFADVVDTNLACAVFGQNNHVCFLSHGFESLSGYDRSTLLGQVAWLESDREWLERAINGAQVKKIHEFHNNVSLTPTDLADNNHLVALMISSKNNGDPFFNLRHAFPVHCKNSTYVMHVVTPVQAAVPGLLWPRSRDVTDLALNAALLESVLGNVHTLANQCTEGTNLPTLAKTKMPQACRALSRLLGDALEGDHFVPRLGTSAVITFQQDIQWGEIYAAVESDLKAVWAACDAQSYMIDPSGRSVTLACALADVSARDCPLVYVSPGFETLTGYTHEYAQGRNCRFLQPNDKAKNHAFNGLELARMREFCTQKQSGKIFNLLLNESRTGVPFWNLLFMTHLTIGQGRQYIFGLQTNIVLQREIMDMMIPQKWTVDGLTFLSKLRAILRAREETFTPSEQSFVSLANDITAQWILECGRSFDCFYEGNHYCPVVGQGATSEFVEQWPEFADICLASVLNLNKIRTAMQHGGNTFVNADQVVCAVADADTIDCPLVFISKSFEEMTGYERDFALGRNCRFLQPNSVHVNKALNGDECGRMRDFCTGDYPAGHTILNLLLNERRNGERFWNLLHMTHLQRKGRRYILAVQTNLEIPMPSLLFTNEVSYLDEEKVEKLVGQLGGFLDNLRQYFRSALNMEEVGDCAEFVLYRILKFLKMVCDDYVGDLAAPRIGAKNIEFFKTHVTWASLCQTLEGVDCSQMADEQGEYFSGIADVKRMFYSVSDLDGLDQPLVYVSDNFMPVTYYKKNFALGRNGRFQQLKTYHWNNLANIEENERLKKFMADGKTQQQAQIVTVCVHEDSDGVPFWSVNVSERTEASGRRYLVTAHWRVVAECEPGVARCLVELLAMDRDAVQEMHRLRNVFDRRFFADGRVALPESRERVLDCLRIWARHFPEHMYMPLVQCRGLTLPCVALEFSSSDQPEVAIDRIASSLRSGIRHLHFAFPLNTVASQDEKLSEMETRLFVLRAAQVLEWLHHSSYMYIGDNIVMSIRAPPHMMSAFSELQKPLRAVKLKFSFWLLDVSSTPSNTSAVSKVVKSWRSMSAAKAAGEVQEIGLYGYCPRILQAVQHASGARISFLAAEHYPGQKDGLPIGILQELRSAGIKLLAYNCFGPRRALLENPLVLRAAQELCIDPEILILSQLEAEGWLSVVPLMQLPKDAVGSDTGVRETNRSRKNSIAQDSLEEVKPPIFPDFNRKYSRQFSVAAGQAFSDWGKDEPDEAPTHAVSHRQSIKRGSTDGADIDSTLVHRKSERHSNVVTPRLTASMLAASAAAHQLSNQLGRDGDGGAPSLSQTLSKRSSQETDAVWPVREPSKNRMSTSSNMYAVSDMIRQSINAPFGNAVSASVAATASAAAAAVAAASASAAAFTTPFANSSAAPPADASASASAASAIAAAAAAVAAASFAEKLSKGSSQVSKAVCQMSHAEDLAENSSPFSEVDAMAESFQAPAWSSEGCSLRAKHAIRQLSPRDRFATCSLDYTGQRSDSLQQRRSRSSQHGGHAKLAPLTSRASKSSTPQSPSLPTGDKSKHFRRRVVGQ